MDRWTVDGRMDGWMGVCVNRTIKTDNEDNCNNPCFVLVFMIKYENIIIESHVTNLRL